LLSVAAFIDVAANGPRATVEIARWFDVGEFQAAWSVRVDMLTAVMLVVVTGVSTLVHIYSIGYMEDDPDQARFFAYLSFFTFAMLTLVTADNFEQLLFGWEGVGLASYWLIGFWYKKDAPNDAAIKAFVTNRVGDFGFALGIAAAFVTFGSVEFDPIFSAIAANAPVTPLGQGAPVAARDATLAFLGMEFNALELIALLLFIGAMGKSAQFFLHVWLPDAMEGPTPVSALIHAATMVTAGVFLVCRCSPIFEHAPAAAAFVTVIGAVTALYAATVGVAQNDIKRVVAYSTCSQLGYMFFAAGVGAYGAAMFHLFTHAFFKALLFLGSGAVIHGLHHEQDMRKMGALRGKMPWTWVLMVIGTLALTGVGIPGTLIGFAGFFSKDRIIEDAFLAGDAGVPFGMFAFWMGVIAAFLTSFYSWRLIFMTFHGAHRGPAQHFDHAHEAPWVMRGPLLVLATGAILAGALFYAPFVGKEADGFWRESLYTAGEASHGADSHGEDAHADDGHGADTHAPDDAHAAAGDHGEDHGDDHGGHHVPTWVLWTPLGVTVAGFLLAYWTYLVMAGLGARIAARGGPLHAFLSNKWYFDEIYDFFLVRGARGLGDAFWKGGDQGVIDRFGPDGVASATTAAGRATAKRQTGYLYHYAFVMLLGVAAFASFILLSARGAGG
ncbi:MAG: NADH-quinone oxidoreductase subunit L, partial [Caulobacterales bacterium]|nr:NADH-quinone oxidoreductase subunit L [Caulobacterales bacterium]